MTYRWDGTHPYHDHANGRVIEPGDEIPTDAADRIASSHPYDVVEADDEADDGADDGADDEASENDDSDDIEWTEEAWLQGNYTERAEAVADGRVDEQLDAIEDVETSENVIEAVEQRRDELSE